MSVATILLILGGLIVLFEALQFGAAALMIAIGAHGAVLALA